MSARLIVAAVVDLLLIVAFAAIGRRTHGGDSGIADTLEVAAPFLIAYAVGAAAVRLEKAPANVIRGIGMWAVTVVMGLSLRGAVFDRGLGTGFVVVTIIVLAAFLLGWRIVAALWRAHRGHAREDAETLTAPPP